MAGKVIGDDGQQGRGYTTVLTASRVIPSDGIIHFPRAFESDVERTSIMYCTIFWRLYGISIVNMNALFPFVTFTEHATHSSVGE